MTGCVVFDLDDTLYLERDYVRSGFKAASEFLAANEAMGGTFAELCADFELGARGNNFDLLLQKRSVPIVRRKALVSRLVHLYRSHCPDIKLSPDVLDAFRSLREAHYSIGLISDGESEVQRRKLTALGLENAFDHLILTGLLGKSFSKPHPMAFEKIEEFSGYPGRRCVYFADNPSKDFVAPRSRGWWCVRVRRRGGLHFCVESPKRGGAHREAESISGAEQLVKTLLKDA